MASETPDSPAAIPEGQSDNTAAWEEQGWNGNSENLTASHTEHSDQHQEPAVSVDPASNSASSGDSASDDEDAGEYDPESITFTTAPAAVATAPTPVVEPSAPAVEPSRPPKKPKTAGGFLVGSSDDEDDDTPTPTPPPEPSLRPVPAPSQTLPLNPSPLQQSTTSQDLPAQASDAQDAAAGAATAASWVRPSTDHVGMLEDRIKDDPRGALDAWLDLIKEHRSRNKIDDARAVYERFFKVFPQAAPVWIDYLKMELSLDNFQQAEHIFGRTLLTIPDVGLWTAYLDYIRRRNDLNDPTGQARQVVNQSYEFVLDNIGQDRDAGQIWHDYIQFLKSGPGQIGGSNWQDQQKVDGLRKAYQRAICIPMANLHSLWREYDQFEQSLNKATARKFIQERSPSYMTARTANTQLENITRGLKKSDLPTLPPAPGFAGDQEFHGQVSLWKSWLAWEKTDPLVLQTDEPETFRQRILLVYKQALMPLRFYPEMWVDAAEWCFENGILSKDGQDTGLQFLVDGVSANPESPLLALKHADRIESTHPVGEGDAGKAALAQAVRAPFDKALGHLYDMVKVKKEKETAALKMVRDEPEGENLEDDDEGEISERPPQHMTKEARIKALQDGFAAQIQILSQHISYLWIALARAFRRIQGQGQQNPPAGVRGIFGEARAKGRLTSDVYVAMALIESEIYRDKVATRIFDRGCKLFPEDEYILVEYLKHLHSQHDNTNARLMFSKSVQAFRQKAETNPVFLSKLKPIYAYFHGYESKYGELAQVKELEKQMTELFPQDPTLTHFAARFATERFNPITVPIIISQATQMRPKLFQSIEQAPMSVRSSPQPVGQAEQSPRPQYLQSVDSPKRPFPADDQDDYNPPRKIARGASPLKGAAGRRLDQQRRAQHGQGASTYANAPAPLPRDITFLLGLIPPAAAFNAQRFNPEGMVRLLGRTNVPDYSDWKAKQGQTSRSDALQSRAHTRQASSEYPPYSYSRESPAPLGRPISPYGGSRAPQAAAPYRNSPLRPGSSGSYEPPPAVYPQFNPMAPPTANGGYPAWQAGNFAPPNPYGQPPAQQPPSQYGGWN
ncbi:hypothetical protein DL770_009760 [Monosporascus sp. CRB-9-2]|nr:hypothetical protein DL770_009760 [Monosporascus sp. CRB-9-2]